MTVSIIVAASRNGVIGHNNRLPWKLPADLKRFKQLTMGHPVVMGRKTFESIGQALPGRTNLVVTRQKGLALAGTQVVGSLEEALRQSAASQELFVIGGATIYQEALKVADRIYLTRLHHDFPGDTYLFVWNPAHWKETFREDHEPNPDNPYRYSFLTYERVHGKNAV